MRSFRIRMTLFTTVLLLGDSAGCCGLGGESGPATLEKQVSAGDLDRFAVIRLGWHGTIASCGAGMVPLVPGGLAHAGERGLPWGGGEEVGVGRLGKYCSTLSLGSLRMNKVMEIVSYL
jgi:hypothetical protein